MKNTQKIIESGFENEELWDNRELGASEEFAKRASPEREKAVRDSLNLHMISIRLPADIIEQLKQLARADGINYQPFIRQIVTRFAREHARDLARTG